MLLGHRRTTGRLSDGEEVFCAGNAAIFPKNNREAHKKEESF